MPIIIGAVALTFLIVIVAPIALLGAMGVENEIVDTESN